MAKDRFVEYTLISKAKCEIHGKIARVSVNLGVSNRKTQNLLQTLLILDKCIYFAVKICASENYP